MSKESVAVRIGGHEYRIRSDDDQESLQEIASQVDDAMNRIRERTGTVDTLDVALLTALNLARELIELKEKGVQGAPDAGRLRALVDLAESTAAAS